MVRKFGTRNQSNHPDSNIGIFTCFSLELRLQIDQSVDGFLCVLFDFLLLLGRELTFTQFYFPSMSSYSSNVNIEPECSMLTVVACTAVEVEPSSQCISTVLMFYIDTSVTWSLL